MRIQQLLWQAANDVLWYYDWRQERMQLSQNCQSMLDIPADYVSWQDFVVTLLPPEEQADVLQAWSAYIAGEREVFACESRVVTSQGLKWIYIQGKAEFDDDGQPLLAAGSITDVTQGKLQKEAIRYLTYFDPSTGLLNRLSLQDKIEHILHTQHKGGLIIYIDVNKFKVIHTTLGGTCGEKILLLIADLLRAYAEPAHSLARVGDDEFVICLEGLFSREYIDDYLEKLIVLFDNPLKIDDTSIQIMLNIGVVEFADETVAPEEIINRAEMAVAKAKAQSGHKVAFYEASLAAAAYERLRLEDQLRKAVDADELWLAYQPIVDSQTLALTGFEVLVRWHSAQYGLVTPAEFIPLAEETGLIIPIGSWVLENACLFMAKLPPAYHHLNISVNLSIVQLMQSDFVERVLDTIETTGIEAQRIVFEITESFLMENVEEHARKLQALRASGIRIYLDDFGTGYSSLQYLQRLPVDVVKIDKSFIADIVRSPLTASLVASVIELVHRLGLKTVAEGVETIEQFEALCSFACDKIQGYWISRPIPEPKVEYFLQTYAAKRPQRH